MNRFLRLAAVCFALATGCASAALGLHKQATGRQTATAINPAVTYAKNCATCHGKDGRATTFKSKHHVHARDLTDPRWQASVSDEHILDAISDGHGRMPAFRGKLTTEQITSLLPYVRGLKR
jgi:mono/diheme cytochrome c family protein